MQESLAAGSRAVAAPRAAALPWYVTAMAFAATSIVVGVIWDISWHQTIGRDTFWTPAHVAIYLGGVLAGICGAYLAFKTTFWGTEHERQRGVRFWGFRAPLGAWIASWGGIAMITSAPFDDWWHNAYGLDVEILSPPHTLLLLGMIGVCLGALLLAVAYQNRQEAGEAKGFGHAYIYVAGVLLALIAVMGMEYRWPNEQHAATFYLVACFAYPAFLVGPALASRLSWPATRIAAIYMAVSLAMIWILPLFPAEPKLAPIFNPVDRMVTDVFPLLLILPAIAFDLILRKFEPVGRRALFVAPLLGAAFLAIFFVSQWYFSSFLMTDMADNRFFANYHWGYGESPGEWRTQFFGLESDPVTAGKLGIAFVIATITSAIGLAWGGWMKRVRR